MDSSKEKPPAGKLYSRLYVERPDNQRDSGKARLRVAATFEGYRSTGETLPTFASEIPRRLGVPFPQAGFGWNYRSFWLDAALSDFLDGITIFADVLKTKRWGCSKWVTAVEAILRDEGMAYTLDEAGGVHPYVDQEFQSLKRAALRGLAESGEKVVHGLAQTAVAALDGRGRNFKHALRDIHEAVETLVKDRTGESRLNSAAAKQLGEKIAASLKSDKRAADYARAMCRSLDEWSNGIHQYRHGQPADEAAEPPEYFAVQGVSQGLAWLRLIIDSGV